MVAVTCHWHGPLFPNCLSVQIPEHSAGNSHAVSHVTTPIRRFRKLSQQPASAPTVKTAIVRDNTTRRVCDPSVQAFCPAPSLAPIRRNPNCLRNTSPGRRLPTELHHNLRHTYMIHVSICIGAKWLRIAQSSKMNETSHWYHVIGSITARDSASLLSVLLYVYCTRTGTCLVIPSY